ncbi:unnamed protein product [Rhodiola kirilowii]
MLLHISPIISIVRPLAAKKNSFNTCDTLHVITIAFVYVDRCGMRRQQQASVDAERNAADKTHLGFRSSRLPRLRSASPSLVDLPTVLADLAYRGSKYVFPKRFESRNLEEALEVSRCARLLGFVPLYEYEIREVEPYMVAEISMPGKSGFDFSGASQSFNALAEYLFGKNTTQDKMDMTTPVFTRKAPSDGEKMEMTTPVITKKEEDKDVWKMSFVMPSKYGADLPKPKDPSVIIKEVPKRIVAVVAFSGYVTDEEVARRESKLREALKNDRTFQVKMGSPVEIAQYNPPFTLPFQRRNEIALEVERKQVAP